MSKVAKQLVQNAVLPARDSKARMAKSIAGIATIRNFVNIPRSNFHPQKL